MDPGTKLGHYEIIGPLGAGGMGEVYRARDTSLKREVAIKVLPEALSADPDRLARLEREAHLLAALNHPNIATIHSLEQFEETRCLVLELVPGESLQERLARGSLAVEVALDLCTQIAAALEAAHGEGIIHRDLKPANVLITPDGRAKVLDFGLAKAFEGQGTAPYMSPEQARGEPLDKRVDIWAFGCVLYESLTASRAFARATVADTLAAIIETEPNWGALPGATPPMVVALIKRCLRKDPARRLHDIADARIEIEEADEDPDALLPAGVAIAEGRPLWMRVAPWALAGLMALVAGAALYWIATLPDPPGSVHFAALPPDVEFSFVENRAPAFAISPDGSQLVYRVAGENEGGDRVYVKHMDQLRGSPIPGIESVAAAGGVFSPDGQEIGFAAEDKLWRAPVSGGTPLPIGDVPYVVRGASWGPDDTIVLGTATNAQHSGLVRVRAQDGALEVLTELNADRGELSHRWPQFLPGGKAVVFTI